MNSQAYSLSEYYYDLNKTYHSYDTDYHSNDFNVYFTIIMSYLFGFLFLYVFTPKINTKTINKAPRIKKTQSLDELKEKIRKLENENKTMKSIICSFIHG